MSPRAPLVVTAMLLLGASPARAQMADVWDETFEGIRHLRRSGFDEAGVFQSYHVAIVDLGDPSVSLRTLLDHDEWRGAKETVSGMADRAGAAVAVNGDYWSWGDADPPQGTTAGEGTCYRAHPERSAFAASRDLGRAEIGRFGTWPIPDGPPDDCPEWFWNAVGAGPQFLFDGEARWDASANANDGNMVDINGDTWFGAEAWGWGDGADPNTALGLSADGATLILATCDGRDAGGAGGCRMAHEMVDLMVELGAADALKLDSGGSTTFYYDGAVQNVPSGGVERAVVDALAVFSERVPCDARLGGEPLTIDDASPCFEPSGDAWWTAAVGEGGSCRWTWAWDGAQQDSSGRWSFEVEAAGRYRLEAYLPDVGLSSARAPYALISAGGEERVVVDQDSARGRWLEIGTFVLGAGSARVELYDHTGEPYLGATDPASRKVVFDAVRLTPLDSERGDAGADGGGADAGDGAGGDAGGGDPDSGARPGVDAGAGAAVGGDEGCGCLAAGPRRIRGHLVWLLLVLAARGRSAGR
ncbi:MAG: phosphodiester glycosidase family protein [Deltaproteobacteria bacterium]|nr:phosphodiester glycosidase family protein [Deltaproteobacteria bacterium]